MPKNYWRGDVSKCLGHCWTLAMHGYPSEGKNAIRFLRGIPGDLSPAPFFSLESKEKNQKKTVLLSSQSRSQEPRLTHVETAPNAIQELTELSVLSKAGTAWYIARAFGSSDDQIAITNPIYFEASNYTAPQPLGRVTCVVTDQSTGQPLEGVVK